MESGAPRCPPTVGGENILLTLTLFGFKKAGGGGDFFKINSFPLGEIKVSFIFFLQFYGQVIDV